MLLQGKCMRAGDAVSTRNGMWELLGVKMF